MTLSASLSASLEWIVNRNGVHRLAVLLELVLASEADQHLLLLVVFVEAQLQLDCVLVQLVVRFQVFLHVGFSFLLREQLLEDPVLHLLVPLVQLVVDPDEQVLLLLHLVRRHRLALLI